MCQSLSSSSNFYLWNPAPLWDCLRGLANSAEGCWKGHRALYIAYMWPVKNFTGMPPNPAPVPYPLVPLDGSVWSQSPCAQPASGKEVVVRYASQGGGGGQRDGASHRRHNTSWEVSQISQESSIRGQQRVSICSWAAKHVALIRALLWMDKPDCRGTRHHLGLPGSISRGPKGKAPKGALSLSGPVEHRGCFLDDLW